MQEEAQLPTPRGVTKEEELLCVKLRSTLDEDSILWLGNIHKDIVGTNCPRARNVITCVTNRQCPKVELDTQEDNKPIIRVKTPGELGVRSSKYVNCVLNDHTYFG